MVLLDHSFPNRSVHVKLSPLTTSKSSQISPNWIMHISPDRLLIMLISHHDKFNLPFCDVNSILMTIKPPYHHVQPCSLQ